MTTNFENDPEFGAIIPKSKAGRSFTIGKILVVLAIIVVVLGLLLPANRSAGPAARRAQCTNNLKQIALALYNYEDEHQALPPAFTTDANGRPLHSWRTLILPYLELSALYEKIDLTKPWDDPVNATASATELAVFNCPETVDPTNETTYLAIVGPDGFLAPRRSRRLSEITDELWSTIAVIDANEDDAVSWMAPFDANEATLMKLDDKAKLYHAGGTNVALADGSVKFLKATTPVLTRRALLTISGNDNEAIKDW